MTGIDGLHALQSGLQQVHTPALFFYGRISGLIGFEQSLRQFVPGDVSEARDQFTRKLGLLVDGEAEAQTKLGVVLEERIRPRGAAPLFVLRPGRRRQVGAINRGAAGGVGDDGPVAEELREELEIRRLAAST